MTKYFSINIIQTLYEVNLSQSWGDEKIYNFQMMKVVMKDILLYHLFSIFENWRQNHVFLSTKHFLIQPNVYQIQQLMVCQNEFKGYNNFILYYLSIFVLICSAWVSWDTCSGSSITTQIRALSRVITSSLNLFV